MKQKDIILVVVMAFISAIVAFILSGWLFGKPQNREQTAEVVDVIRPDFTEPPVKYFNASSVNPTQLITIGDTQNPNPFGNQSQ